MPKVFFIIPSLGFNSTKAIFAFLNFGSFNLFSASFLSENKETALVIHSSTPSPLNTLSGCSLLCEKNLPIAQDCRLLFYNNNHHTVEHLRVDIVLATTQTILLPLFPYLCISRKVTASVQVNKYFSEYLSTPIYHHFTRYLCNKLS